MYTRIVRRLPNAITHVGRYIYESPLVACKLASELLNSRGLLIFANEANANLRNRLPVGGGCVYVLQIFFLHFLFFFVFFRPTKNMRQPFSGTAERIFMKLLPNNRGKFSLKRRAAASRMANVDDLRNLRYDSGGITRGPHARRLRYTTMSGRMDVIV